MRDQSLAKHSFLPSGETSHPPLFKVAGLVQDNIEIKQGQSLAVMANEARIEKGGLITVARDLSSRWALQWLLAAAHLEQSGRALSNRE